MRAFRVPLIALLFLLTTVPAWAFTVVLKDGSKIVAAAPYTVEGDRAIIVLPNGTRTFLDADEIDVEATKKANVVDYGTAMVLEDGQWKQLEQGASVSREDQREEMMNLVAASRARELEVAKRERDESKGQLPRTQGGFVDLSKITQQRFPNAELAQEIATYLSGQGVERTRVMLGTEDDRPYLEIVTPSEASVFRSLEACANALLIFNERYPEEVGQFEILMLSPRQERSGQFVMTPDMAAELINEGREVAAFFVEYVQF